MNTSTRTDMIFMKLKNTVLLLLFLGISCGKMPNENAKNKMAVTTPQIQQQLLCVGAGNTTEYLSLLKDKKVGIVANQTSIIISAKKQHVHLVDSLLAHGIAVKKVFAPEHGFRGTADAGEKIKDGTDAKTGLPIISLYGDNKKPTAAQLSNLDVVLFDIQDVGARFYTYISTLHYVMEACAASGIPVMVMDRPNPNGHYVDGPVLDLTYKSFVGMHPVPVVHGMTIGEYAQMINEEGWLADGVRCNISVIPVTGYTHATSYNLPVKPSPNLPNATAIHLYPSLCFFEGTRISVGRGTSYQFQLYGAPFLTKREFSFVPKPNEGAKKPLYNGERCYGEDLRATKKPDQLQLGWLIKTYAETQDKSIFFNSFFTKLAGTPLLQQHIEAGMSEEAIRNTWVEDLEQFKKIRKKYLIYDDTL